MVHAHGMCLKLRSGTDVTGKQCAPPVPTATATVHNSSAGARQIKNLPIVQYNISRVSPTQTSVVCTPQEYIRKKGSVFISKFNVPIDCMPPRDPGHSPHQARHTFSTGSSLQMSRMHAVMCDIIYRCLFRLERFARARGGAGDREGIRPAPWHALWRCHV